MVKLIVFVELTISYAAKKKHVNLNLQKLATVNHFQLALMVVITVYVALINKYVIKVTIVFLNQLLQDSAFQIVLMEHRIVSVELIM